LLFFMFRETVEDLDAFVGEDVAGGFLNGGRNLV